MRINLSLCKPVRFTFYEAVLYHWEILLLRSLNSNKVHCLNGLHGRPLRNLGGRVIFVTFLTFHRVLRHDLGLTRHAVRTQACIE